MINDGTEIAILSIGNPGNFVMEAQEQFKKMGISVAHWNMIFIKPLDEKVLNDIFKRFDKVITIEDGCLQGGFGSAIIEFMSDKGYNSKVKRLGIPDNFINHGSQNDLYKDCGIDINSVIKAVKELAGSESMSQTG
jgi:1-deoxy-D-xylulose-5-phosphate synthase